MAGCDGVFHDTFARYLQRRLPLLPARSGYCWGHVDDTGAIGRLIPLPDDLNAERLRVLAGVTYFGVSTKAQRELGFAARPRLSAKTRGAGVQIIPPESVFI
jgi:hypothetical protein